MVVKYYNVAIDIFCEFEARGGRTQLETHTIPRMNPVPPIEGNIRLYIRWSPPPSPTQSFPPL